MNPIKETLLFKSLLSLFPGEKQEQQSDVLLLALADAATTSPVKWELAAPHLAMTWVLTPQGRDFWRELNDKYNEKHIVY